MYLFCVEEGIIKNFLLSWHVPENLSFIFIGFLKEKIKEIKKNAPASFSGVR
jgi:hypothetical protein